MQRDKKRQSFRFGSRQRTRTHPRLQFRKVQHAVEHLQADSGKKLRHIRVQDGHRQHSSGSIKLLPYRGNGHDRRTEIGVWIKRVY